MLRYWLCFASAVCLAGHCGANYCRDANLCCPGRDSACVVQKAHQNAIIEDLTDKPCYCDHACLKLGDCCPDFRETCGVIDCVVSGWGPWSDCDTNCGSGSMVRSRRVVQASAHGGRHCPSLVQRRACQEHRGCSEDSNVPLRDETAMILPGGLSVSRHSNDTVDIRKNLRLRNPDDPEANSHREYCAQFEVTKVSKACHTDSDYKSLREVIDCVVSGWGPWSDCDTNCGSGSMVRSRRVVQASAHGGRHCPSLVQRRACQEHRGCSEDSNVPLRDETAMILPGGLSVSRHSNDTVDIRKNLRLRNPDDPEANSHREYCAQFEVTKVSKACHTDSDYKSLREGNTVCVLCETAALRRDLKWRCSGHGVAGHATRFYALVAPHCHGKWVKAPQNPDKRSDCCANPDFIFV